MLAEQLFTKHAVPMVPDLAGGRPAVIAAGSAAPRQNSLNLNMEHQKQTNWCWAAVSFSVNHLFGGTAWTQCKIAGAELNKSRCCIDPLDPTNPQEDCNKTWFLQKALSRVRNLRKFTAGSKSFVDVIREIDGGLPLGCRIGWSAGGGHFVAIDGYLEQAGVMDVDVCDPWYGDSTISYTSFMTNYQGKGSWTHSYTTKR